jgi:DNA polymerase III delta prime subunit
MKHEDVRKIIEELQAMRKLDDEEFAEKVRLVLSDYERLKNEERLKNALGSM